MDEKDQEIARLEEEVERLEEELEELYEKESETIRELNDTIDDQDKTITRLQDRLKFVNMLAQAGIDTDHLNVSRELELIELLKNFNQ